jgi:predicted transcriptional regulator
MLKRRLLKSGPESRFLKRAFATGFKQDDTLPMIMLKELVLPTGVPDAVLIYQSQIQLDRVIPRRTFSTIHIQVIAHLYDVGRATTDELATSLVIPRQSLQIILQELAKANLLELRKDKVYSRSLKKVFAAQRIIAIEAKLQNWRKALLQATANFWFASHSYVLLPPLRCLNLIVKEAKKLGVGVLIFDGKKMRLAAKPKRRRLPVSYGSWLIHESALPRLVQGITL